MTERDKSQDGSDAAGSDAMNPKEPSQQELDRDRKENPDTSKESSKDGSG